MSRVVYLTPKALEISKRLAERHPQGAIFRNTSGRKWTPYATNCRFRRAKKKIGVKLSLYALRHTWITVAGQPEGEGGRVPPVIPRRYTGRGPRVAGQRQAIGGGVDGVGRRRATLGQVRLVIVDQLIDLHEVGKNAEQVYSGEAVEVLPELMRAGGSPGEVRPKVLIGVHGNKIVSGEDDLPDGFEH